MNIGRRIARRLRRVAGFSVDMPSDSRQMTIERVFHAPPLTPELIAAIHLISPQLRLTKSERDRSEWEADQNAACWDEYEALAPLFHAMPQPARILEVGCGMGRSLVFFNKKLAWESCVFHAYEGNGSGTKYTFDGPRFDDSFCGNIGVLRSVLTYNGIGNVSVFDAGEVRLRELPGPYDFLYSFYSVGFHWSLEHFLSDLLALMHERSIAAFTVTEGFKPFPALSELKYRILSAPRKDPHEDPVRLLVLSKTDLPQLD